MDINSKPTMLKTVLFTMEEFIKTVIYYFHSRKSAKTALWRNPHKQ